MSRCRLSRVVHCWPVALTYWRLSWQMAQAAGAWSPSTYCVPQVVQMKFVTVHPPWCQFTHTRRDRPAGSAEGYSPESLTVE